MAPLKPLSAFKPGETGVVDHLETSDEASLKLMELGIGPGEGLCFLRQAPFGGPIEIELMGFRLCIREAEAASILMQSTGTRDHTR